MPAQATMNSLTIRSTPPDHPQVLALVAQLDAYVHGGPPDNGSSVFMEQRWPAP